MLLSASPLAYARTETFQSGNSAFFVCAFQSPVVGDSSDWKKRCYSKIYKGHYKNLMISSNFHETYDKKRLTDVLDSQNWP